MRDKIMSERQSDMVVKKVVVPSHSISSNPKQQPFDAKVAKMVWRDA